MGRRKPTAVALTLLAVLMLVAAGCGGGGSKNSGATTPAYGTPTQATTTEAATTEAMTTEAAPTTTAAVTTEAAPATTSLSGIASAGNCKQLADLGRTYSQAISGAASSQDLKKQAALLKEFADKTPADIRPDFQVYADFVGKIAEAYGGAVPSGTPSAETLAKLQKALATINSQRLKQASTNITAWIKKNCGG